MPALAFLSYRREDSHHTALGLYFQLRARFGARQVFMDLSGISGGDVWPQRLKRVLGEANVLLAIIGPGWLRAADQWGRRRLDLPDDWVRNELLLAGNTGKPIVPLLVGSLKTMPPPEALPMELSWLPDRQAYSLRDDHWEADVNELAGLLVTTYGFTQTEQAVPLPDPEVKIASLSDEELDRELTALSGWEPVESLIPGDYPNSRHELRRVYRFRSFRRAIEFMNRAVEPINRLQHHPRWENQWRTVTVYLSTWDIGHRISPLDVELARAFDEIYAELKSPGR